MPTAAVSSTSTTAMAMMTAETGRTSLTAVSTLASGVEEGRPGWEELLGEVGVRPGCQLGQELRRGASRAPGSLRGQRGGAGGAGDVTSWSTVGHCVLRLAKDRSLACLPSLPPALPLWRVYV